MFVNVDVVIKSELKCSLNYKILILMMECLVCKIKTFTSLLFEIKFQLYVINFTMLQICRKEQILMKKNLKFDKMTFFFYNKSYLIYFKSQNLDVFQ